MKQLTLATTGFERYSKATRRAAFLAEMERVVPWSALCGLIEPFYPKPGNGRPPVGVERMLRIYFLQQWFNLSDPAVEEALYDSAAMRRFVGIDLGREPVPDETTVCRFRHLLEAHDLGRQLFEEVQRHLMAKGIKVATGTIVDATIINAPSSTKNADKARDPEMHQTKKGNQWYFGIERAFRSRQPQQVDPRGGGDAGQCRRQHGAAPPVARQRNPRVGRPGVSRPAGSDPPARTQGAGLHQSPLPPSRRRGRSRARDKPDQIEGAGQSRASNRDHQAGLRLRQGALSRAQKEHSSPARDLRARQSVYRASASIALRCGVICLASRPAVAGAEGCYTNNSAANPRTLTGCCNVNSRYLPAAPLFRPSLGEATGMTPSTGDVRSFRTKDGWGLNLEQQIAPDFGVFARASVSQGTVEEVDFTDINQSISGGLSLTGSRWGRPDDTVGLAGAINRISHQGKLYLAAGGLGGIIGDGRLPNAGPEQILETYYRVALFSFAHAAFHYQFINHPAYNRDRGPVSIFGLQLHLQF